MLLRRTVLLQNFIMSAKKKGKKVEIVTSWTKLDLRNLDSSMRLFTADKGVL